MKVFIVYREVPRLYADDDAEHLLDSIYFSEAKAMDRLAQLKSQGEDGKISLEIVVDGRTVVDGE